MAMRIALETESHEQKVLISDDHNFLSKVIGYPDSKSFPMLASIDWYGNTVFNRMQIDRLLTEWETLFSKAVAPAERSLLEAVKELSLNSREDVHQYVVFIGD